MSHRHVLRRPAALIVGLAAAALAAAPTPAFAHTPSSYKTARRHVESRARSSVGTPYSYGGMSRGGFDCSGFTRWAYLDHGADLPHSSLAQFELGSQGRHRRVWKRSNLEVGDLVFHKTTAARVGHAGIYVGGNRFISATSSAGVQVRSLTDSYWGPRWVGATRLAATFRWERWGYRGPR